MNPQQPQRGQTSLRHTCRLSWAHFSFLGPPSKSGEGEEIRDGKVGEGDGWETSRAKAPPHTARTHKAKKIKRFSIAVASEPAQPKGVKIVVV